MTRKTHIIWMICVFCVEPLFWNSVAGLGSWHTQWHRWHEAERGVRYLVRFIPPWGLPQSHCWGSGVRARPAVPLRPKVFANLRHQLSLVVFPQWDDSWQKLYKKKKMSKWVTSLCVSWSKQCKLSHRSVIDWAWNKACNCWLTKPADTCCWLKV